MKVTLVDNIAAVAADQWNQMLDDDYPFLRYEFLAALENSGSASEHSGWWPQHCLVYDGEGVEQELIAAMPMYKKHHSQGEYVFDHDWAYAYRPAWLELLSKVADGDSVLRLVRVAVY